MAAALTAAVVGAVLTAAVVAVAPVVLAPAVADTAASAVAQAPMAAIAAVHGKDTEVVAGTGAEGRAENHRRRAIPAQQGVRHHWVALIPRRDGTRLDDPAAAAARLLVMKWRGPTVNGTPLVAPTVRAVVAPTVLLEQRWLRTAGSAGMASLPMAVHSVAEVLAAEALAAEHSAAGAADLAGDAGPADGALAMVGALAGIPIGRYIRILTGTTCRGMILTATMLRPTIFILTRLRMRWVASADAVWFAGFGKYFNLPESPPGAGDRVRPAQESFRCRQCGSIR